MASGSRTVDLSEVRRRELVAIKARRQEVVRRFVQVPGVGWVRGATFFAYVDTPWRFRSKSALWKYLGIGLERRHSGEGPARLRVARQAHRRLKGMILGAAITAITRSKNPFERQYKHWIIEGGLSPRNARRNVARSLAATLWGMWKNGSDYQAQWVGVGP